MKDESDESYIISVDLNLEATREDLAPLLEELNPILNRVVERLLEYPDETATGILPARFSKIWFSKITCPV